MSRTVGHSVGRAATALLILTVAPIAIGTAYAAAAAFGIIGTGAGATGTARIARVMTSEETWRSLCWTLVIVTSATIVSVAAAVWSVDELTRHRLSRRLVIFPLAVPHLAAALGVLLLLGQSGLLSRVLFAVGLLQRPADFPALIYDANGIGLFVAFVWKELPFLALTAMAARAGIPDALLEAARSVGGTAADVRRSIVRPLVLRGVTPAAIAVFAFLFGQYEMASVLGPGSPPPFAVLVYERMSDPVLAQRGDAYVLALLAMLITALLVFAYGRLMRAPTEPVS